VDLREIRSAWWRKPHWLWLSRDDSLRRQSLEHEINRVQQTLWAAVSPSAWLNEPMAIRAATSLSAQMAEASKSGLAIPETLITNSWPDVRSFAGDHAVAFKSPGGLFQSDDGPGRTLFTRRLEDSDLDLIDPSVLPYPGFIQRFVDKAREWRVTVVGERVFPAAIYAEGERPRMDWRRDQRTDQVQFRAEKLPEAVAAKCRNVTSGLGLRYSAIDLVEHPDGEFVFLEANPNGQFLWLEEDLGLRISSAITEELCRIASCS
jgi:glutathione synthase/RimK-type ligase-like ATP-grasp enzyme